MKSLDAFLPAYDVSTRHEVSIAVDPALQAAKRRAEAA